MKRCGAVWTTVLQYRHATLAISEDYETASANQSGDRAGLQLFGRRNGVPEIFEEQSSPQCANLPLTFVFDRKPKMTEVNNGNGRQGAASKAPRGWAGPLATCAGGRGRQGGASSAALLAPFKRRSRRMTGDAKGPSRSRRKPTGADLALAAAGALSHGEWLALLLEREATWREDHRLKARLRFARLRHQAGPEDVDYRAARGLDRALFASLLKGAWIKAAETVIISVRGA